MMIVMVYCELCFLFTEDSDDNVLSTDDDDDAPEDVSFQTGKQTALQQMRDAIKHINEEKIRVKEKRRKIDQQFKEQKVNIHFKIISFQRSCDLLQLLSTILSARCCH